VFNLFKKKKDDVVLPAVMRDSRQYPTRPDKVDEEHLLRYQQYAEAIKEQKAVYLEAEMSGQEMLTEEQADAVEAALLKESEALGRKNHGLPGKYHW
jgi:hypothetical protein